MKRKVVFLLLVVAYSISGANAQDLTIINQTGCNLMIYSGDINVNGTDYSWGSETPGISMTYGQTTALFTTNPAITSAWQSPPPPPPPNYAQRLFYGVPPNIIFVPYSQGGSKYIGFKFRQPNTSSGSGYISAANPHVVSSAPVGCNNGNPFTVDWTGLATNPVITIHS